MQHERVVGVLRSSLRAQQQRRLSLRRAAHFSGTAAGRQRLLLISDLDGTLIDSEGKHSNPGPADGCMDRFNSFWVSMRNRMGEDAKFVICTGNSLEKCLELVSAYGVDLTLIDALVCDTGASAYSGDGKALLVPSTPDGKDSSPEDCWLWQRHDNAPLRGTTRGVWNKRELCDAIERECPGQYMLNPSLYTKTGKLDDPTASPFKHSVIAKNIATAEKIVCVCESLPFAVSSNCHSANWAVQVQKKLR